MRLRALRSPKVIAIAGGAIFLVLLGFVVREQIMQRAARRIAPAAVDLTGEQRKALEEKITRYSAAIASNPDDFNAYVEVALARADMGDRDGAADIYRTMNQRFPGNYLSFQNLGKLYDDAGQYAFAAEQYLLAIQNAPRNAHLYRNIADLYMHRYRERVGDIPRIMQKGLAEFPGSIDLMAILATYHRDFGDPQEAIHWYEQLLVFDQTNTTAIEEIKELRRKLGR